MPAQDEVVTNATPAKRKPNKRRAKVRIDHRFALGRRIKHLTAIFRAKLGPDADDPVMDAAVRRAAEVTVLSEQMRAKMLRGERVNTETMLRLSRTADLAVRRLRLDKVKAQPSEPTVAEYVASLEREVEA
jgi:hypothetical protein